MTSCHSADIATVLRLKRISGSFLGIPQMLLQRERKRSSSFGPAELVRAAGVAALAEVAEVALATELTSDVVEVARNRNRAVSVHKPFARFASVACNGHILEAGFTFALTVRPFRLLRESLKHRLGAINGMKLSPYDGTDS
jgi:hypothetical protein